jgi:uncharacterized protein (DUF362 family)/Pyruvate/2-oxoacid:ferredoxin oxidoreductase delta subunit
MTNSIVSLHPCKTYTLEPIRQAIRACFAPLGGMARFVRPGMRVLLKPNLLAMNTPEQSVTTHPLIVQAVAELVKESGGVVWIGDSANSSVRENESDLLWQKTGMTDAARKAGAELVPFKGVSWKRLHDYNYMIARPVLDADLVINLPKLKTHTQTLYTGAVKNLFGAIPGARKTAAHIHAPGIQDFSRVLVDVLQIVRPALTIMDAVIGLDGNGPGAGGTPHTYGCIAASADPIALDTVFTRAMGYRTGEIVHLAQAGERQLGMTDMNQIKIEGDITLLNFGRLQLPTSHWFFNIPSWLSSPVANRIKQHPVVDASKCTACGTCETVCPANVITNGKPPAFHLNDCIGCMCCSESCPEGAIAPQRTWIARMVGLGQ